MEYIQAIRIFKQHASPAIRIHIKPKCHNRNFCVKSTIVNNIRMVCTIVAHLLRHVCSRGYVTTEKKGSSQLES